MMMLARRANEQMEAFKQGIIGGPIGVQMHGCTLGVIGMGRIGASLHISCSIYCCQNFCLLIDGDHQHNDCKD